MREYIANLTYTHKGVLFMGCTVDTNYKAKGLDCIKLTTPKYFAVISPLTGSAVFRLHDNINNIEVFRYSESCSLDEYNDAREIWGLPTLYLPNRFDRGVLKTSDAVYQLPVNETDLVNHIHGWVHKREHTVENTFANDEKAVLTTSFTFTDKDEMFEYFPLRFRIEYTFTLSDEKGLVQEIKLINQSEKALPVSICTHTCISAPLSPDGSEETMRLCVPILEKCELDERCLPTEKMLPLSDWDMEYKNGTKRPTLQVISNDMYTAADNLLDGESFYGVIITDTKTGRRLCNEVSKEFKFWNMWNHDGDKGYFCPEPMTAMINAPNLSLPREVSGYNELSSGEVFTCSQRFFTL